MTSRLTHWALEELARPVAVGIAFVIETLYNLFFRERDIRLSIEGDRQLAYEIRRDMPFLFNEHSASQIALESIYNPLPESFQHPRPFGYAVVIFLVDDLLFRFLRGRGELDIQVTKQYDPENWAELPTILQWLGWRDQLGGPRLFNSLEDAAEVLRPLMKQLIDAYADPVYSQMKQRVSDARDDERVALRQLSAELNRRLYG
jgi:hypothetical protein